MDFTAVSAFLIDNKLYITAGIFILSMLIQLIFYLGIYSRLLVYKKPVNPGQTEPVSVIICARNEAENLEKYLPTVLNQRYPEFEVIVVNHASSDETEEVLQRFQAQYPHLRVTQLREDKKFSHGKKLAVTLGIKAAKYDILLFTDADCEPAGNLWLASMTGNLAAPKTICLGYGGYRSEKGLLNQYIRFDTLIIALQYLSFAVCGMPYMGVGRNLAYRKSFFYKTRGFTNHLHLLSGDDDLFVNENATGQNTGIAISHESHTRSNPSASFAQWKWQKRRHFTTAPLYKYKHKFMLGLEPFSRLLFYALFVYLLMVPELRWYALGAFGLRMMIQLIVYKSAMNHLKENNLLLISLLFDIAALFINGILFITNRISLRRRIWK